MRSVTSAGGGEPVVLLAGSGLIRSDRSWAYPDPRDAWRGRRAGQHHGSGHRHGSRGTSMTANAAASSPDLNLRDLIGGAALLASTANAVMQLARPAVGYGVLESTVESGQTMRHPFRR